MAFEQSSETTTHSGEMLGCIGISLCLVARDIPQFLALTALSGNHALKYGLAAARALLFIVVLAIVWVERKRGRQLELGPAAFQIGTLCAALAQSIGLSLLMLAEEAPRQLLGTVLLGFGQSGLVLMWATWLLRRSPHRMLKFLGIAFLCAGGIEMALALMQAAALFALSLAMPFASCLFAWLSTLRQGYPEYKTYKRGKRFASDARLIEYLAILFVCSFTVRQLTDGWMPQSNAGNILAFELLGGLGTALAALLVLATVKMGRRHRNGGVYLLLAVPVIVLAAYMSSYLSGTASALYMTPLFMMRKCLLLFALLLPAVYASGRDRFMGFGIAMLVVELGNVLQTATNRLLEPIAAPPEIATSIIVTISLVAMCTIPLAIILPAKDQFNQNELKNAVSNEEKLKQLREEALDAIRDEYGLTTREREVLGYLNAGRNAEYISKTLYIAHSTAKSHIAHIYQKTGMNSQQKIMDDVESRISAAKEAE